MTSRTGILLLLAALPALAQNPQTNYDEAKVPAYTLPNPLIAKDGRPVRTAAEWAAQRKYYLGIYSDLVFGQITVDSKKVAWEVQSIDRQALGGKATRKLVTVFFNGKGDPRMRMLLYLPSGAKQPVPVFLALGFTGIEGVSADPGVPLGDRWLRDPATKEMVKRAAPDTARAAAASRWDLDEILGHGYGLAVVDYNDIEPDFSGGWKYGIRQLMVKPGENEQDHSGAIGAWAWGISRAMDYLEKDRDVDAKHVALFGHSRLGKTALWAGAQDTRFAMVISNESGEGGAAISRRDYGERTTDLNTHFPHWFRTAYRQFNDREDRMPFDSHILISLIAPRPVYVASAEGDQWSDPKGEFLGAANAGPVYELLGKKGLGTTTMPAVHQPIMHDVAYHIRAGKHDVTSYDWEQYVKFADLHWGSRQ